MLLLLLPALEQLTLRQAVKRTFERNDIHWHEVEFFLTACRRERPDLTVGVLQAFVFVVRCNAKDDSSLPTIKELATALGVSFSTAARQAEILSDGPKGRSGLGWITKIKGEDSRTRHLQVTSAGVAFLAKVAKGTAQFKEATST